MMQRPQAPHHRHLISRADVSTFTFEVWPSSRSASLHQQEGGARGQSDATAAPKPSGGCSADLRGLLQERQDLPVVH